MVKVMATGTFDLLHMGHIYYLREAKKLGNTLVVVVATDTTVRKLKHDPITSQESRVNLIKELKMVDEVYLGHDNDMYKIVQEIKPDVIALGFDQFHDEDLINRELIKRNLNVKLVRIPRYEGGSDLDGTRRIIQKVITAHEFQKKMQLIEGKS